MKMDHMVNLVFKAEVSLDPVITIMVNLKTSDLNNESCACCREHFCNLITRCNHFFHQACLFKKIERGPKCPKCSTSITSNQLYEKFLAGYEINKKDIYQANFESLVDFVHFIADSKVEIDENIYKIAFCHSYNLDWNLTSSGRDGINLLYKAAKNGHLFIVKLYLEYYVGKHFDEEYYPLFGACEGNNLEIIDLLLEKGAKIDKVDPKTGYTFAHFVAMSGNLDLIDKVIEMKVDFLVRNKENTTPLHLACQEGHFDAAKKLIDLGADIKYLNADGYSMLHAACVSGNLDLFKFMIDSGLDIHATYKNGVSSVHGAVYGGNFDILMYLTERKVDTSKCSFSPLHIATELNNLGMVKKLIELGFDINSVDSDGNTPLHYACAQELDEIAHHLLDRGADFDLLNAKGESAVHRAYDLENFDIIFHPRLRNQALIRALRNGNREAIDKLDALGDERASIISEFPGKFFEILEPLLSNPEADLDSTILDADGNNLFLLACKLNLQHAVSYALDCKLNVDVTNHNGDNPLHFTCANGDFEAALDICSLPDTDHMITARNKEGRSPLHCAFIGDNPPKLIHYLAIYDTINVADNDGNTPVHLAFAIGYYECFVDLEKLNIEYNIKNREGKTPLHLAAENGHLDAVKFLIEKGADATIVDNDNHLAVDLAKMKNYYEIIEFLSSLIK